MYYSYSLLKKKKKERKINKNTEHKRKKRQYDIDCIMCRLVRIFNSLQYLYIYNVF